MDLEAALRKVTLLIMDCDGVLTDGRLYYGPTGEELKTFDVRDGYGLVRWREAGFRSAIISGRDSPIVEMRFAGLGVEFILQGHQEKGRVFEQLLAEAGVHASESIYVGDDVPDTDPMRKAGVAVAVADAHPAARSAAHLITKAPGGRGAIREVIDLILSAKGAA